MTESATRDRVLIAAALITKGIIDVGAPARLTAEAAATNPQLIELRNAVDRIYLALIGPQPN
jgi:hypothetical protein